HGQSGRHRFGEDQPEPLLDGRKAETVSAGIFYREPRASHLAEQNRPVAQPKLPVERSQPGRLRTLPYDADLSVRDSFAEDQRGPPEIVEALARILPRPCWARGGGMPPSGRRGVCVAAG